jgi:hypothetical protein
MGATKSSQLPNFMTKYPQTESSLFAQFCTTCPLYSSIGGKVLACHWHHRWVSAAPDLYPDVATFSDRRDPEILSQATVNTTSAKGQALAEWLVIAGANTSINANELYTLAVAFFSFGMPLGADESRRCGNFAYADLEVSNATSTGMPVDNPGEPFPSHCTVRDLSAQEEVAEFLFFELSSCL